MASTVPENDENSPKGAPKVEYFDDATGFTQSKVNINTGKQDAGYWSRANNFSMDTVTINHGVATPTSGTVPGHWEPQSGRTSVLGQRLGEPAGASGASEGSHNHQVPSAQNAPPRLLLTNKREHASIEPENIENQAPNFYIPPHLVCIVQGILNTVAPYISAGVINQNGISYK